MPLAAKASNRFAVVVRPDRPEQYLVVGSTGARAWTPHPYEATAFASMREAVRTALHLPGELRAFGLPAPGECLAVHTLH